MPYRSALATVRPRQADTTSVVQSTAHWRLALTILAASCLLGALSSCSSVGERLVDRASPSAFKYRAGLPREDYAKQKITPPVTVHNNQLTHQGRRGELTETELAMARTAWKYFENNYQPETGLVNAVNGYPSVTLWDLASYLGGLVAAHELEIIDKAEFDRRIRKLYGTINKVDLFRDELPNKAYHTKTAERVDYRNKPGEIGYSALDIGRFLIWSRIIKERYPEHANSVDRAVLRWNFCQVVKGGSLHGSYVDKDTKETRYVQEGRLGYEEYGSKGFQLWGFDTTKASLPDPYEFAPIYGINIPYDTRDPRLLKAHNYVVTESYVLDGIEFNWDSADDTTSPDHVHTDRWSRDVAEAIYQVQENRFRATGILTARTEHQLDKSPYFVYDTIYTDGYPWNTITDTGKYVPEFASVAVKGAAGLWALWDTPYTDILFRAIEGAHNPEKGFYEGIYENGKGMINTFTANNNGVLLETLLYKVQGKLLKHSNRVSMWDRVVEDPFHDAEQCLPSADDTCWIDGSCSSTQMRLKRSGGLGR